MNSWLKKTIALTRKVFETKYGGKLKSLDVRYEILLTSKKAIFSLITFKTSDELITSGWVID